MGPNVAHYLVLVRDRLIIRYVFSEMTTLGCVRARVRRTWG